jgi:hypothetical protein
MDYSRAAAGEKFAFNGMDTVHQVDSLPPGKYPLAINVRAYLQDVITPRLPQGNALITTLAGIAVHSLRKLIYAVGSWPRGKYVLVSGVGASLFVDAVSVATGMTGFRLSMVTFRPDASPEPWMYIADFGGQDIHGMSIGRQVKVNSSGTVYKTGIAEPNDPATVANGPNAAPAVSSPIFYRYIYRSTATGAKSNPSPPMTTGFVLGAFNPQVTAVASTDPQVDVIDFFRFDAGLLDYTYVGTAQNSAPVFKDVYSDAAVANNPLLEFDNFEPFPSIDLPHKGTIVIHNSLIQWGSGDRFNVNWAPGTIIQTGIGNYTLYRRPVDDSTIIILEDAGGVPINTDYSVTNATVLNQIVPAWWGPTDNAGYFFACGDPLREGTLYFTKGNNPDSAPDTNQIEVTSPSEPLIGGCIVGGLGMVFSSERAWLIYPNFSQAIATVVGVVGSPFNLVESISERGLYCRQGICTDGGGWVYFITKDGIRKSPAGSGSQSITDTDLYNLFPHEGVPQQTYNVVTYSGGVPTVLYTVSPPNYENREAMVLRFAQGYVYFDYVGLDAARHTLVYDTIHDGWSVDVYGDGVSVHADNEGSFVGIPSLTPSALESGVGTLMGCTDGTIRRFDPAGGEAATMTLLTSAYNNGDRRSTKHFGDVFIEALVPTGKTAFTATLFSQKFANLLAGEISPVTYPQIVDGLRHGDVGEITNGSGIYVQDVELSLEIPVASVGAKLFTWQPTMIPQPETTGQRNTDWDDGGSPGAKFVQGVIIEADSLNVAKSFTAQSGDDDSIHGFAEMGAGIAFNGQSMKALSFAVPFVAHNFRIVPDSIPWNLFKVQWVFVPYPELVKEWHTEGTSHGLAGWQHVKELNIAHLSTADLTLTLIRDFGAPIVVTVPNSGGIQTKTLVQVPPPSKFKIVSYNLTSTQPFRLWVEDLEVFVVDWESDGGYKLVKPFGGPSKLSAVL